MEPVHILIASLTIVTTNHRFEPSEPNRQMRNAVGVGS